MKRRVKGFFTWYTIFEMSRQALGSTKPPNGMGTWGSFLEVKRPKRDVDHLPASSAEVKNEWSLYTFSLWRGQEQLYLICY